MLIPLTASHFSLTKCGGGRERGERFVTPLTFDSLETGLTDAALLPASCDEAVEGEKKEEEEGEKI